MAGLIRIKQYDENAALQAQNPGADPFVNIWPDLNLLDGSGVTVNKAGVIFVADASRHVIWKLNEGMTPMLFAGKNGTAGFVNGVAASARFNTPKDIACDSAGNLYVFDSGNHRIRKIDTNGTVTTVTMVNASITDMSLSVAPNGDIFAIAAAV